MSWLVPSCINGDLQGTPKNSCGAMHGMSHVCEVTVELYHKYSYVSNVDLTYTSRCTCDRQYTLASVCSYITIYVPAQHYRRVAYLMISSRGFI